MDYGITDKSQEKQVDEMLRDEEGIYAPTRYTGKRITDHRAIVVKIEMGNVKEDKKMEKTKVGTFTTNKHGQTIK